MTEPTEAPAPRTLPLEAIADEPVGGKAEGLARLIAMGLEVPKGFVIIDASPGDLPSDLEQAYAAIGGGRVAVRSSAIGEDGADASFAGQFETLLDVEGVEAVREAVESCLESARSARAVSYRETRTERDAMRMSVVVQQMVDARAAGVLFTVDPVSGRRDRIVIDAVEGLGEKLVSGHATPDHYLVDRAGPIAKRELVGEEPILDDFMIHAITVMALEAERHHGAPLDMEWAIDRAGQPCWLQARPVTRLPGDPNELDRERLPDDFYTRCNIGEMMPGAVTPLTFSITGGGIEVGMQRMFIGCGIQREVVPEFRFVAMYFGHMFLNLTYLTEMCRHVMSSKVEQLTLAVCGRLIPELEVGELSSFPRRFANGLRYARYMLSANKARADFEVLVRELRFPEESSALAMYRAIDERMPVIHDAYDLHMRGSTGSGALAPALALILAEGEPPTEEHHAEVARLLAGAENVESADIAEGAGRVVERLAEVEAAEEAFALAPAAAALEWLSGDAAGEAGAEFARYMERHGHRAVRELELRQKEWAADPLPLVTSLQAGLKARLKAVAEGREETHHAPEPTGDLPFKMRKLVGLAREGVRAREHTKSLLVKTTVRFKQAYRRLGELMAGEGLLADEDAVFFLTHGELGQLVNSPGGDPALSALALTRRDALPHQMELVFEDVFVGKPEPVAVAHLGAEGELKGKPVSRGIVEGRARVVRTLAEAEALEEGEILVAPITDVGWTPYFGLIAGLVTDIGSAVSHGAVVAREYGLPAVVSCTGATGTIETGDLLVLDGNRGVVTRK